MRADAVNAWYEFTVYKKCEDLTIPICGLCGNTGYLATTSTAVTNGTREACGVDAFCICPNGRALKKGWSGHKWGGTSVRSTIGRWKATKEEAEKS